MESEEVVYCGNLWTPTVSTSTVFLAFSFGGKKGNRNDEAVYQIGQRCYKDQIGKNLLYHKTSLEFDTPLMQQDKQLWS